MKKHILLLTLYYIGIGLGIAQSIRIDPQLACFEGSISVELHIISKDSIQVSPGTRTQLTDSSYVVSKIAAGQIVQIRQYAATGIRETNYAVPQVEVDPVLPPIVSGSVLCGKSEPAVLRALVPQGQTVDWYDAPTGGNVLAKGTEELTVTKAGRYYAESRNAQLTCLAGSHERAVGIVTQNKSLCPMVRLTRKPLRSY